MLTYIIRRLLLMIPTLLGVTAVVFFVMALAPGGFGGTVLNQLGAQTEGEEAKRIREYFSRRYGLDKSPVVQYGRWLNQVLPFGFRTSSQLKFNDDDVLAASSALEESKTLKDLFAIEHTKILATELAAYLGVKPVEAAGRLTAAVDDVDKANALIEEIRTIDKSRSAFEPIAKPEGEFALSIKNKILNRLAREIAGRDRVLFSQPYFKWPDLGKSLRGRPVTGLLAEAVPITVLLNLITIPIIYIVAVITGVYAARHRGTFIDVGTGSTMIALWSIPAMWIGVMLIGFIANKQHIQWFPTGGLHDIEADSMAFLPVFAESGFQRGWLLDFIWHLVLPIICMTYGGFAVLSKITRSAVLENISSDYVRTARAKGVGERDVLFRHVFRNSMMPLITIFSSLLPSLFAGSVIIETIFSIQGLGKLGVDAAFMKDRELVMATTLIGSMMGLGCLIFRDIWYAVADPRVSFDK